MDEEIKLDRRVRKTKKAIRNALASLMMEKEINEITIREIADLADVNRKTFYNYYSGVYSVVDEIENEIVGSFRQALGQVDFRRDMNNPYSIFEKLTDIINQDLDFYGHLLSAKENTMLISKVGSLLKEMTRTAMIDQLSVDAQTADIVLDYSLSGMLAVYQSWFNSGREQSIEEVSKVISILCFSGFNHLLEMRQSTKPPEK